MQYRRTISIVVASIVAVCISGGSVAAAFENVSRSYIKGEESIATGSLVSLVNGSEESVVKTTSKNAHKMMGVVVSPNQSLFAINIVPDGVQVAVSGTADVLVSSISGPITAGDQVSISPISGVGMKAEPGLRVIGIAQHGFAADTKGAMTQRVVDSKGVAREIHLGTIPVVIAIGYAPQDSLSDVGLVGSTKRFAATLIGHPVSTTRVLVSAGIAFVAMILLVVVIYGAIRGSLISIGRNPLARVSIYRALTKVVFAAVFIVIVAVVVVYFILR